MFAGGFTMTLLLSRLDADNAARRARREEAFEVVQGLRRLSASSIGAIVVEWLRVAYGWKLRGPSAISPDRILERNRQNLWLRAAAGDHRATWLDLNDLTKAAYGVPQTQLALAAPAGIPEPQELTGTPWEAVQCWGPRELEAIYCEIKHEFGGVSF
jgi:hypothetical protein